MSDVATTTPPQDPPNAGDGTTPTGDQTATPTETALGGNRASKGGGDPEKPEAITLKFPEGAAEDKALLEDFTKFATEHKMSSATAQASFERYLKGTADALTQAQAKALEKHNSRVTAWGEALKTDKEIGGATYDASMALAKAAVQKFGSPELTKVLNETGLGNHPELVRLMVKVGKAISEDSISGSQGAEAEDNTYEGRLKKLTTALYHQDDNKE